MFVRFLFVVKFVCICDCVLLMCFCLCLFVFSLQGSAYVPPPRLLAVFLFLCALSVCSCCVLFVCRLSLFSVSLFVSCLL